MGSIPSKVPVFPPANCLAFGLCKAWVCFKIGEPFLDNFKKGTQEESNHLDLLACFSILSLTQHGPESNRSTW